MANRLAAARVRIVLYGTSVPIVDKLPPPGPARGRISEVS